MLGRYTHITGNGSNSLGDINGGGLGSWIGGRVRLVSIVNLDVQASFAGHYLSGHNQLPGRAYTASIGGFGFDMGALLGLSINLGREISFGANANYFYSNTPNGQNALGRDYDNVFSGFGGGLSLIYNLTHVVQANNATFCAEAGRTPESMRNRISELSTQIQELRVTNRQLHQQVLQLYPSINLNSISGLGDIPEFSNSESVETIQSIENCQELGSFLTIYERKRDELRVQNARLQGIQEGRERLTPPVLTDTQRLRALNISVDGRFDARHTALILQNRELIDRLSHERRNPVFSDRRPIAVVVEATADYNGAFQSQTAKPINVLAEDSRFFTLYYQVSSTTELRNVLENIRRVTGRNIHTLVIGGHGNRRALQLGSDGSQDLQSLESRDVARGDLNYLRDVMDLNECELVLHACSNGGVRSLDDRDPTHALASEIYDRIGGVNVLSMDRPGNISIFRIRDNLTVEIQWSDAQPSFFYRHHFPPGFLSPNSTSLQRPAGQRP